MPVVRKNQQTGTETAPTISRSKVATEKQDFSGITLPSEKSTPPSDPLAYRWLIYGEGGIGKSSLVSRMADKLDVFFYVWETAQTGLSLYKSKTLTSWELALHYTHLLSQGNHNFGAVCWDTGRPAYDRCLEYVCRKNYMTHPGEVNDYGASWKKVTDEFISHMVKLESINLPVITIAHHKIFEVNTATSKHWKTEPDLSGKCSQFFQENADMVAYYFMYGNKRYLQITGDDFVFAKGNPDGRFLTPNGERIVRIPMGNSADESYANLLAAWRNEQEETYADLHSRLIVDEAARKARRKPTKDKR